MHVFTSETSMWMPESGQRAIARNLKSQIGNFKLQSPAPRAAVLESNGTRQKTPKIELW